MRPVMHNHIHTLYVITCAPVPVSDRMFSRPCMSAVDVSMQLSCVLVFFLSPLRRRACNFVFTKQNRKKESGTQLCERYHSCLFVCLCPFGCRTFVRSARCRSYSWVDTHTKVQRCERPKTRASSQRIIRGRCVRSSTHVPAGQAGYYGIYLFGPVVRAAAATAAAVTLWNYSN